MSTGEPVSSDFPVPIPTGGSHGRPCTYHYDSEGDWGRSDQDYELGACTCGDGRNDIGADPGCDAASSHNPCRPATTRRAQGGHAGIHRTNRHDGRRCYRPGIRDGRAQAIRQPEEGGHSGHHGDDRRGCGTGVCRRCFGRVLKPRPQRYRGTSISMPAGPQAGSIALWRWSQPLRDEAFDVNAGWPAPEWLPQATSHRKAGPEVIGSATVS
jgi:hypothetical protein